ncbi:MAG: cysteine hydrolase [Desulfobacterales bacterium]|nr:cysteine hydrolase [Desulfobacterales bacterium]
MLLLVVDMQKGLFTQETPRFDTKGVVERINKLIDKVRANWGKIIFIQHDGPAGDVLEPQTPGWELLEDLNRDYVDTIIRKTACDAFLDTPLLDTIRSFGDNQIIITGCATDFCVDTTIRSATSKGLDVTVARDAHTTADRPHLDAETIIRHHNWSWENLILSCGSLRVLSTDKIIEAL